MIETKEVDNVTKYYVFLRIICNFITKKNIIYSYGVILKKILFFVESNKFPLHGPYYIGGIFAYLYNLFSHFSNRKISMLEPTTKKKERVLI